MKRPGYHKIKIIRLIKKKKIKSVFVYPCRLTPANFNEDPLLSIIWVKTLLLKQKAKHSFHSTAAYMNPLSVAKSATRIW